MQLVEPKIPENPIIRQRNTTKWLLENAYTPKSKQLKTRFTKDDYDKNPANYLHFSKLHNEFLYVNPLCGSRDVECIWYLYQGIALRVDETFAEFHCPECQKYTFVEYYRDDS